MTITFTIAASLTGITVPPARIDARQLAAFRAFAHENGALTGSQPYNDPTFPSYDFEARVCAWSLSALSSLFGYDEAVIAVLEEVQFRGRRVLFARDRTTGELTIAVAATLDAAADITLTSPDADDMLDALRLDLEPGELSADELRTKLKDPHTIERLWRAGLHRYLPRLDTLAAVQIEDDETHLVWV